MRLILVLVFFLSVGTLLGATEEEKPAGETSAPTPPVDVSPAPPPFKFGLVSEAGVAMAGGNTRSATYQIKSEASFIWPSDVLKLRGNYFLNTSAVPVTNPLVKSGESWSVGARYERTIYRNLGAYVGNSWEGNRFAGFAFRTNVDAGIQYYLIEGDRKDNYLLTEAGYRFTNEDRKGIVGATAPYFSIHAIRLYIDGVKMLTPSVRAKLWIEVLPDLGNGQNLMINFEPSLSVVLTSSLSLKLAFSGKYDGLPSIPTNLKFDYLYTTSLVTTF